MEEVQAAGGVRDTEGEAESESERAAWRRRHLHWI